MNYRRIKNLEEHAPLLISERGLSSGIRSGRVREACDRSARPATARKFDEDYLVAQIAHDLNNVLGTISGYGMLAQLKLSPGEPRRCIDNVLKASTRARVLTQQLFAIGRGDLIRAARSASSALSRRPSSGSRSRCPKECSSRGLCWPQRRTCWLMQPSSTRSS